MNKPRYPVIPLTPLEDAGRRHFLKLMAASMAMASGACSGPPAEKIVPYVDMPENMVPGQPIFYATSFVRHGDAQGVLVETNMGRPGKIEGNAAHPASLGATDVFAQASILQLWDPDRSQVVRQQESLSTWPAFEQTLEQKLQELRKKGGAGLRILTGRITSPTLERQLDALRQTYPEAQWHAYDPLHDDGAVRAARLAFGREVDTVYRFEHAEVVLSLDADLLSAWPGSVRYARDMAQRRVGNVEGASFRMYAMESTPTITGAFADECVTRSPAEIERSLWRIAATLGVGPGMGMAPDDSTRKWEQAVVKALRGAQGRAVIIAGPTLSSSTRALAHVLNHRLGNTGRTVMHIPRVAAGPPIHAESITQLAGDMQRGRVGILLMLDVNPVYDAPVDLDFADALSQVPLSIHLGLYRDETARASAWHFPQSHGYEQWSDARAYDGTTGIVQPVIAPLYQGRSIHEVVAMFLPDTNRNGYRLVQDLWRSRARGNADVFWQDALRKGVVDDTRFDALTLAPTGIPSLPSLPAEGIQAVFLPDASVGGGEFANNAWLQELPRPITSLAWDNAALMSSATAVQLQLATGDIVRLQIPGFSVEAPVWVHDAQADDIVALPLGYGRHAAGSVGNGVGFDAYRLRTLASAEGSLAVDVRKTGKRHSFAVRQREMDTHDREIVHVKTVQEVRSHSAEEIKEKEKPLPSLYPEMPYPDYKWGMAINLNACIGCNACTIACQAENNIPVVGKEEFMKGREMHWIRVDSYRTKGRTVFQPVPCMHCEKAPCEEVCPVGATMHDSEGLNVQVYNRCVGTRFCSNNCPYKVRRFNFLQYSNTETESLKALQNPEVTVRRRGVMEKCTYCIQRITRARLDAEKLGRHLRDGEVVTACQAVCPTQAIVFGDLNDPSSKVNQAKRSPLDFALLEELNTRPRTTYAARVINPDPELE